MKKILVLSGHPALTTSSHANKAVVEGIKKSFPGAEVRDLPKLYPNYKVDVAKEQAEILKADIIVIEFPLHWYSIPTAIQAYVEDVFTFGFAYGTGGDKLKGKKFIYSFTTGGKETDYSPTGYNRHTIDKYLVRLEQIAVLCGMQPDFVYTFDMTYFPGMPEERLADIKQRAAAHAERLIAKIKS